MQVKLSTSYIICLSLGVTNIYANTTSKNKDKPNVIFIYADDLGKGMLSVYGQKHITTPNIDALFKQGTSFENAYGCMLSAPARASLLTGYHDCNTDKWRISGGGQFVTTPDQLSMIDRSEARIDSLDTLLPEGDLYLPQVFKQAGYTTAEIGKLEWGFTATRKQMKAHGWDYYYGYLDHVRCHGFYPPFLFENGEIAIIEGNTHKNCAKTRENETTEAYKERWNMDGKKTYSQDLFMQKILAFIRENKDQPFFLFHPTQLPHGPVAIPSVHPEVENNPLLTPLEKEYASMVKMLDDNVGTIMEELKRLGLEKNTIIVFSADNGHEIYYSQKNRCEKPYRNLQTGKLFDDLTNKYYSNLSGDVFNGNAGMAGLKRSNLQGGVNIPLVFYNKKMIPKGKVRKDVVSNYDFINTMADLLQVELPIKKDGVSYLQTLLKKSPLDKNRFVVYGSNLGPAIVTNDGWKLRYYKKTDIYELYNLREDPLEQTNKIEDHPQKAEELIKLLLKECNGNLQNGINRYG